MFNFPLYKRKFLLTAYIAVIGNDTANRLAILGIKDLYRVAHCDKKILYKIFGINAEYLIDRVLY